MAINSNKPKLKLMWAFSVLAMLLQISCADVSESDIDPPSDAESDEVEVSGIVQSLVGPVRVVEASYGLNCGAPRQNATWDVAKCNGIRNCSYKVSVGTLGDPAYRCAKDFDVRYTCGTDAVYSRHINGEANGKTINLDCTNVPSASGSISVVSGTYGSNCGQPYGNVTKDVRGLCSGYGTCFYNIQTTFIGDPVRQCAKSYATNYTCSNHPDRVRTAFAYAEANGQTVTLTCPP